MIYDTVSKGEDGLYHVRAFTDDRKRKFVQLNDVKIVEKTADDISFEPADFTKIDELHDTNVPRGVL